MKEKNTTAVQWLIEQFKIYLPSIHQEGLKQKFDQALAMEREQIEFAYEQGWDDQREDEKYNPVGYYDTTYET